MQESGEQRVPPPESFTTFLIHLLRGSDSFPSSTFFRLWSSLLWLEVVRSTSSATGYGTVHAVISNCGCVGAVITGSDTVPIRVPVRRAESACARLGSATSRPLGAVCIMRDDRPAGASAHARK